MKTPSARHAHTYKVAKQETAQLFSHTESNENKLIQGFVGGGYIATLSVIEPKYKSIKIFLKADNRFHAATRLPQFPDAFYFIEENPEYKLSICGAGLQHPSRAEGLFHEQKEN